MFLDTNSMNPAALCAAIQIPDAAMEVSQPRARPPRQEPFSTNAAHHETIDAIVYFGRLRQDMIRARTKLILQAQASLRRLFDGDKKKAAKVFGEASKDPDHEHRGTLSPYIVALDVLDKQQDQYERELVRAVKKLPVFAWAKSVKGFGDLSLACIIGEASGYGRDSGEFYSVGDFKSVSALWKRMGLAVMNGNRQGIVEKTASKEERSALFIAHGYSGSRRSVMWNIGNSLILGMGLFRPYFDEDINANESYTPLQRVFASRARYEAMRVLPHRNPDGSTKYNPDGSEMRIARNDKTGKDSYTAHAANRAKRYTEKRLLRCLYSEWRACMG